MGNCQLSVKAEKESVLCSLGYFTGVLLKVRNHYKSNNLSEKYTITMLRTLLYFFLLWGFWWLRFLIIEIMHCQSVKFIIYVADVVTAYIRRNYSNCMLCFCLGGPCMLCYFPWDHTFSKIYFLCLCSPHLCTWCNNLQPAKPYQVRTLFKLC